MTPIQQLMLGVGASKKTYVDDVFNTYLWEGTGNSQTINNGIDLAGEGGLVWTKARNINDNHALMDNTSKTGTYYNEHSSSATYALQTDRDWGISSLNNNGFTLGGSNNQFNYSGGEYASWSFRKAKGFFDLVTWTGNATTRVISHALGSKPGMILIKRTDTATDWVVYHRSADTVAPTTNPEYYYLTLNTTAIATGAGAGRFGNAAVTSTGFTVGSDGSVNANSATYVAYVFAGGESTAATARSVLFEGNASNGNSQYSFLSAPNTNQLGDNTYALGTNDFTVECWVNPNSFASNSGNKGIWGLGHGSENLIVEVQSDGRINVIKDDSTLINTSSGALKLNKWTHVALVRHSNTIKLYLNGIEITSGSLTASLDLGDGYEGLRVGNRLGTEHAGWRGHISNFRFVKGTAVYTSAFRVPTEPLTNISGTIALVCQNSAENVATVWPGGGTNVNNYGNETSSSDSPFDDPAAFKFGESGSESVIKCGSYVGNGSTRQIIDIGFEAQWVLTKNITTAYHWCLADSMRGAADHNALNQPVTLPNQNNTDPTGNYIAMVNQGFKLLGPENISNKDGDIYVYMAIRRPDGYVGKPAEAGTDVFAIDTGNSSETIPVWDSGFPVDFAIKKTYASSADWYASARLLQARYLKTNSSDVEANGNGLYFDSNVGYGVLGSTYSWGTNKMAWMWKRHAGMDVVTYDGNGRAGRGVPHGLSKTPEMIWVKKRSSSSDGNWSVYHKGLNDGTEPEDHYVNLNTDGAVADNFYRWNDTPHSSTHFTLGTSGSVNDSGQIYAAFLFASVDGISKVGSYTGNATARNITFGFQPRFIIMKRPNSIDDWYMIDTTRGWGSGDDSYLKLNHDQQAYSNADFGAPTSNGWDIPNNFINNDGDDWIYYAHA